MPFYPPLLFPSPSPCPSSSCPSLSSPSFLFWLFPFYPPLLFPSPSPSPPHPRPLQHLRPPHQPTSRRETSWPLSWQLSSPFSSSLFPPSSSTSLGRAPSSSPSYPSCPSCSSCSSSS